MTDQKLVDELEKALRDEAYDGGFGYMGDEQFPAYVRTLAETAAEVVEKAYTPSDDERTYLAGAIRSGFYGLDADNPDDEDFAIADAVLAAGFHRSEVPEPSAEAWSTEDRREALAEGLRRWSIEGQHDRVDQRDHDLYGMGARQGFALGAEWWKSTRAALEPHGEPSDALIERYLLEEWKHERWGYGDDDVPRCECGERLHEGDHGPVRSLEQHRVRVSFAAAAVTEQGENR